MTEQSEESQPIRICGCRWCRYIDDPDALFNPDEWGDPLPRRPMKPLTLLLSVRFDPAEAKIIYTAVDAAGVNLHEFARRAVLDAATE